MQVGAAAAAALAGPLQSNVVQVSTCVNSWCRRSCSGWSEAGLQNSPTAPRQQMEKEKSRGNVVCLLQI